MTADVEPGHRAEERVPGPPLASLAGVRLGVVLWGGLALVDAGRVTATPSYAEFGALAALVIVTAVGMGTATACCAAVIGWLILDGFVEHRFGALGFDGNPDMARLALLAGLALAASRVRR